MGHQNMEWNEEKKYQKNGTQNMKHIKKYGIKYDRKQIWNTKYGIENVEQKTWTAPAKHLLPGTTVDGNIRNVVYLF